MDTETRNRIQHATQDARTLLEREYAGQLEGMFDIHLDGGIASTPGSHLDANHRVQRSKLVAAVEHFRSGGLKAADAVAGYVREAAFTTLNRFVALKMLSVRALVQDCISRGEQSAGFKEFTGLAPGLVQLPDHGYRIYIESLFDEIGREVGVLFDRRDPASLLWPRRQALLDLLSILSAAELADVWDKDETIGWVYQYFNSDEERRRMRAESQAPRNSRELAVRNQFFTPRYVVEFLTDNTLGRIWYEMQQGKTRLIDECDYVVRRPEEVFLAEGQRVPEGVANIDGSPSQRELLKQAVYIPFRPKKDPRDLKLLDPACGSAHFLIYAFDLFVVIYEEAWTDESSPVSEITGHTLRHDYPTLDALQRALPGLILRHNLHGIEIDPRAAQIAALALWMRTQRAYNDLDIARVDRPPIAKTNIVTAEPMPGEKQLRREFVTSLDKHLGRLVQRMFEKMELAGETGVLLKIEDEIRSAIQDIYGETGELFRKTDEERWCEAERALLGALQLYAEQAQNGRAFQRRLFAEDAARGFALIDLCRQRYDVVLMNPPFGGPTPAGKAALRAAFPFGHRELTLCMLESALDRLLNKGRVGCVASRTPFFIGSAERWRRHHRISEGSLRVWADLGLGVLDDATVEVAAVVMGQDFESGESTGPVCLRLSGHGHDGLWKQRTLHSAVASIAQGFPPGERHVLFLPRWRQLAGVPRASFVYWMSPRGYEVLSASSTLEPAIGTAKQGCSTSDDFRFVRLWWEPTRQESDQKQRFFTFAKGGTSSQYFDNFDFVINYADDGRELKAFVEEKTAAIFGRGDWSRWINSVEYYFRPGLAFARRTKRFCVYPLPAQAIFSAAGQAIFLENEKLLLPALALLNSKPMNLLLQGFLGRFELEPQYEVGVVQELPWPEFRDDDSARLASLANSAWRAAEGIGGRAETSRLFVSPFGDNRSEFTEDAVEGERRERQNAIAALNHAAASIDEVAAELLGFDTDTRELTDELVGPAPWLGDGRKELGTTEYAQCVASWLFGAAVGRWSHSPSAAPEIIGPFAHLPIQPPGSAASDGRRGVLVDDPGHDADIEAAIQSAALAAWGDRAEDSIHFLRRVLDRPGGLRGYFSMSFFDAHKTLYSRRTRSAPIYWQLATPSATYSVWLYCHHLTNDTFYKVLNDYVAPKLQHEERRLAGLVQSTGASSTATQRKEMAEQEAFVDALRAFREEIARVAPLWNPDLNDGIIINFAPLWRLVPQHRAWQTECKDCWDKLVAGDYDWAHLAMHLWPERVVPKCVEDRSLAIAHGLEEVFWVEGSDGKWQQRKVDRATIGELIKKRTSTAVKGALASFLDAPAPTSTRITARTNSRVSSRRAARRNTALEPGER